jgi:uncharacterized protein YxjI
MTFKLMALAPQIFVTDATGETICYVKQKMFKLKEAVNVFQDSSQQAKLCELKADRIIDFSANYHFFDTSGESFGGLRRQGMRSIWRAHYELLDEQDQLLATVREENPMAKVADSFLGEVPLLGMFSGYLFHPKYLMTASNGQPMLRLTKQPAMFEGRYTVEKLSEFDPVDELRSLMGLLMMTLLERNRG